MRRLFAPALLLAPAAAQDRIALADGWHLAPVTADGAVPDDGAFVEAPVPGTFEDVLGPQFDGVAVYRCRLPDLHGAADGRRASLVFRAAATHARVSLNARSLGEHLGGWTAFRVELGDAARLDGSDQLEVWLDEKVGHNTQGFHPIIQPHFGGLWQGVELHLDAGPTLDELGLLTFGDGDELRVEAPVRRGPGAAPDALRLHVDVLDGAVSVAAAEVEALAGRATSLRLRVPAVRRWAPAHPNLYRVRLQLRTNDGSVAHEVERRVGFRHLVADGQRLLLDGAPLSVRGVLHWGYEPPLFAPHADPSLWRTEMEDMRARGFNLIKACLWVPPPAFYAVADEVGMLVWAEYPTWHPQFTPEHKDALLTEFGEFFAHDRSHVSAPLRSLTCETGQSADLDVIRSLYRDAHARIPQTLVVDDSSWLGWQRVFDFYDEHPYGNNSWWPGRLRYFRDFIAEREAKPLLLGECMAGDTWFDLAAWRSAHGERELWWAPRCLGDQPRFERWIVDRFGDDTLRSLRPISLDYAMRNRKYQIERLRLDLPDAGYVVSVMRDFTLARMGLYDHVGRAKWPAEAWAWHGDTMLCLDSDGDARAFPSGELRLPVRVAHAGRGPCRGTLRVWLEGREGASVTAPLHVDAGAVSAPVVLRPQLEVQAPSRLRLHAELRGSHAARSSWDIWLLPPPEVGDTAAVRVVDALDRDTLAFLRAGGRVLHLAGDRQRAVKTQGIWFLRGSVFTPPHPLAARVPPELLRELQTFDLESGTVIPGAPWLEQVDPILAFWETHDIAEVRCHLMLFECRVGQGRLVVSSLDHDSFAGRWLRGELVRHLRDGEAPRRELAADTVAALQQLLASDTLELGDWRFVTDPDDQGLRQGYPERLPSGTRTMRAGRHWEGQGLPHYDGIAWYAIDVDVPASFRGEPAHLVFDGVDDSFTLWVNGREAGRFGDPARNETVWLQQVSAEVSALLRPGERNTVTLRVVDHGGAGGIWKPVRLTTGPVAPSSDLLR